jgi:hypothetical protein|tara:strand:- start:6013 stop:7344 length:1332 start_codon:yes stop_codon:yes gene_type:complete
MANEFASLQGLPTSLSVGKVYSKLKPTSSGVSLPAGESDRKYKSIYDNEKMVVATDGFTVYVAMQPLTMMDDALNNSSTPPTYFKFTVGETPTYSFFFGENSPCYSLLAPSIKVGSITFDSKKDEYEIEFVPFQTTEVAPIIIKKGKFTWKYANEIGSNGFLYQKEQTGFPSLFEFVAPHSQSTISIFREQMEKDSSELGTLINKMNNVGEGVYMYNATAVEVYMTPQSFTVNAALEKEFLLPSKVDYDDYTKLDITKNYIQFQCMMGSLRTDNYTGYDKADPSTYVATIQFPGDDAKLAPMGTKDGTTVACGIESAENRVLDTITPVFKNDVLVSVKLVFIDGSSYEFPDPETGMFSATDKDTGGLLEGTVQNLVQQNGNWKDAYTNECANRIARNINDNLTIKDGDLILTSAIAWRTSKWVKIIVPTKDGSKLITIPKRGA